MAWNKMLIALQYRIKLNQENSSLDTTLSKGIHKLNTTNASFMMLGKVSRTTQISFPDRFEPESSLLMT